MEISEWTLDEEHCQRLENLRLNAHKVIAIVNFGYIGAHVRKLVVPLSLIATALTVLFNVAFVHSSVLGVVASCIYIAFVGFLLGRTFLGDEHEFSSRFLFGIFLLISSLILVGTPIVVFYELNVPTLAIVLFSPLVPLVVLLKFQGLNLAKRKSATEKADDAPYFSPIYVVVLVLIACAGFLIIKARSGWINGTIWDVVSSSFFVTYFLAAFSLVGVILYSRTKTTSKMLLTTMFSLLSITISAVVLYPGDIGDPIGQMAASRLMLDYGTVRTPLNLDLGLWNIYYMMKRNGLTLLTAMVAKIFVVDIYWIHTFIIAVLWGVFVPLVAYEITGMISGKGRVSVFAAFLTTFFSPFLIWGSISTGNGLGYVFISVSLYFTVRYLKSHEKPIPFLLAIITATATGLAHPFTGVMSFAFLFLAFGLKRYRITKMKSPLLARILMIVSFIICLLVLQSTFALQNTVYLYFASPEVRANYIREGVIAFDPEKLFKTDLWYLIFGEYMDFSFKDVFLRGVMPVFGFVGLVYALSKKDRYDKFLALFIFLAFAVCVIDYRIMKYAMFAVPFGPSRIWVMRDLIAVPFMAVTIDFTVRFLDGALRKTMLNPAFKEVAKKFSGRQIIVWVLVGLSLASLATSSLSESYVYSTLHPTQLEVDAVKYIDEHTDGRYTVLSTNTWNALIGGAFVGTRNPEKYYIYGSFLYPSVAEMMEYIEEHEVGVGYFIAPSFRTPDFDDVIAEASRNFGLFKVLGNDDGEIYIFDYKIPPLPTGYPDPDADVMAFYWNTPSSYIIQNGFARVIFNPKGKSLDVRDYWGDLYESINLEETLTDGEKLGNLTSVECFLNGTWIKWLPVQDVVSVQQLNFRLNFEGDSLIGVVEKGKPYMQLWWERGHATSFTLRTGDFHRLYIPGIVGGDKPYNVSSRDFGFLYTLSRTPDVTLRPPHGSEASHSSLNCSQIVRDCNLTITKSYLDYRVYVQNNASRGQWANIEVWLPDEIYLGISPSISYSVDDGKTWTSGSTTLYLETLGGVDVNWGVTLPRQTSDIPVVWKYVTGGVGGKYPPTIDFTISEGAQNRLLFGIYLPANDSVLVRLSASIYYVDQLSMTYIFTEFDLNGMKGNLTKFYNYGLSEYIGGLSLTTGPISLNVTESMTTKTAKTESLSVTLSPGTIFSLLFAKGDTTIDTDNDGIPDLIE